MTKIELRDRIRKALGGTATPMAASLALDAVLRSIQEGLAEDGRVHLSGFGAFEVAALKERLMLTPHHQSKQLIAARRHVKFKAAPKQVLTLYPPPS